MDLRQQMTHRAPFTDAGSENGNQWEEIRFGITQEAVEVWPLEHRMGVDGTIYFRSPLSGITVNEIIGVAVQDWALIQGAEIQRNIARLLAMPRDQLEAEIVLYSLKCLR